MFLNLFCRRKLKNHKIAEADVTTAKKKRKFKEKLNIQIMSEYQMLECLSGRTVESHMGNLTFYILETCYTQSPYSVKMPLYGYMMCDLFCLF